MKYPRALIALFLPLVMLLAACGGTADATATVEPLPSVPGPLIPTPPPPSPTPAAADATPTTAPTDEPVAAVTPPVPWDRQNIFTTMLGEVPAEWDVEPCEGEAPFLCVREDGNTLGSVELLVIPLRTHPEFQSFLEDHGLTPGQPPQESEAYDAAARLALADLAESHLAIIEEDREATFGASVRFERLPIEPVEMGSLPGVTFGFTLLDAADRASEHYRNYVTFDSEAIYWLGAGYDPANVVTWTSAEDLQRFEPALGEIAADLKLPPPVAATNVEEVEIIGENVLLSGAYGITVFAEAPAGETYRVVGISADGRWWQVECGPSETCWLPADSERVRAVE